MRYTRTAATVCLVLSLTGQAAASEFRQLTDRNEFVRLVEGRTLSRLGIRLEVAPDGTIRGSAFGWPVTGSWAWDAGHFCRSMDWGGTDIGFNCQAVLVNDDTLRFISDRGQGEFADLRLR